MERFMREISGFPRCVPSDLDCNDFVYGALYNDIADRTINQLGAGTHLAHPVGMFNNSKSQLWFQENFDAIPKYSGASHSFPFELMHGQPRFRLITQLNVPISNYVNISPFFAADHTWSIAFRVYNIHLNASAIILQVFRNKTAYENAAALVPANRLTPIVEPGYFIDLNEGDYGFHSHQISFEQDIPQDIYPPFGQSHACLCTVIMHSLSGSTGNYIRQSCFINSVKLTQILEP